MRVKRLRGGQANTSTIPSKKATDLLEYFLKFMFFVISIGIIKDFATGNALVGGILLFFTLFCMFILYLTTLGTDYIKDPNGNSIIKIILGVVMIFNYPAIITSFLGLGFIFCFVLVSLFSK